VRKARVLSRRSELLAEHAGLAERLAHAKSRQAADVLIEQMENLYDEIDRTCRPLAFADRVDASIPPTVPNCEQARERLQWEYMLAAQYGDLWSEVVDSRGQRVGAFMSYFCCLAGPVWERCGTVMDSKSWSRLHDDPLKPRQRWYCNCCLGRYRTRFGVVIEVLTPPTATCPQGSWHYMRAEVPDGDMEDVKAMRLESVLDPENPRDLFDRLPEATPSLAGGMLRKAYPHEMASGKEAFAAQTFKIVDVDAFYALPKFPWKQVFSLFTAS
jgi:hypothetical protein